MIDDERRSVPSFVVVDIVIVNDNGAFSIDLVADFVTADVVVFLHDFCMLFLLAWIGLD